MDVTALTKHVWDESFVRMVDALSGGSQRVHVVGFSARDSASKLCRFTFIGRTDSPILETFSVLMRTDSPEVTDLKRAYTFDAVDSLKTDALRFVQGKLAA